MRYDDRVHYLYRCFDKDGSLLYVGSTHDLMGRLASHRSSTPWAGEVAKVKARVYPSGPSCRAAERDAIGTEHPRWNVMGRWKHRHGWSREMWLAYIAAIDIRTNGRPSTWQRTHRQNVARAFEFTFGERPPAEVVVLRARRAA